MLKSYQCCRFNDSSENIHHIEWLAVWAEQVHRMPCSSKSEQNIVQIPSAAPSFMGIWATRSHLKDTLLYLYVIWNILKSADLQETILTPVICHKHVRYNDGVTLYFSMKFPSVAPEKTGNGYFSYMSADFSFLNLQSIPFVIPSGALLTSSSWAMSGAT